MSEAENAGAGAAPASSKSARTSGSRRETIGWVPHDGIMCFVNCLEAFVWVGRVLFAVRETKVINQTLKHVSEAHANGVAHKAAKTFKCFNVCRVVYGCGCGCVNSGFVVGRKGWQLSERVALLACSDVCAAETAEWGLWLKLQSGIQKGATQHQPQIPL